MSKTITVEDLKIELNFIPSDAKVFCRDLGYGYQLVFTDSKLGEISRIFIKKKE